MAMPIEFFSQHVHEGDPSFHAYLQDEELLLDHPELYADVQPHFLHDYYRLLPDEIRPNDAFLLWGSPHSRSTLHVDPYNWTGSNAVIFGRKRWRLYAPGQDALLLGFESDCAFPLGCRQHRSPLDAFEAEGAASQHAPFASAACLEGEVLPGEYLLIPSGWYHQALNTAETLAIASQVWNVANFEAVWDKIVSFPGNVDARGRCEKARGAGGRDP
jgi:hypothetical protein